MNDSLSMQLPPSIYQNNYWRGGRSLGWLFSASVSRIVTHDGRLICSDINNNFVRPVCRRRGRHRRWPLLRSPLRVTAEDELESKILLFSFSTTDSIAAETCLSRSILFPCIGRIRVDWNASPAFYKRQPSADSRWVDSFWCRWCCSYVSFSWWGGSRWWACCILRSGCTCDDVETMDCCNSCILNSIRSTLEMSRWCVTDDTVISPRRLDKWWFIPEASR